MKAQHTHSHTDNSQPTQAHTLKLSRTLFSTFIDFSLGGHVCCLQWKRKRKWFMRVCVCEVER